MWIDLSPNHGQEGETNGETIHAKQELLTINAINLFGEKIVRLARCNRAKRNEVRLRRENAADPRNRFQLQARAVRIAKCPMPRAWFKNGQLFGNTEDLNTQPDFS